jgi:dTMP kinase
MNNAERLEKLDRILDELLEMPHDSVLLVEGTKDRMAMVLLGVNGIIICVQAEGGPLKVAERLHNEGQSAVIMTDWDPKGEEIAKELKHYLSSLCVKCDISIRARLRSLCGGEIRDVQSLPSLYCRLVTEAVRRKESMN